MQEEARTNGKKMFDVADYGSFEVMLEDIEEYIVEQLGDFLA